MKRLTALVPAAVALACLAAAGTALAHRPKAHHGAATTQAASGCQLDARTGRVKHVIYLQFDNVHFTRDNPNVPSDLEQMPHLLSFLESQGSFLDRDHTILTAHTAGGILTSLTGVYPSQHGQSVSNSYRYYHPDGTSSTGVSFAYWTDGIFDPANPAPTDPAPNMVTASGANAPAPWVPYTRAGCDWGGVSMANTILENVPVDVPHVFGPGSPQAAEAVSNPTLAQADFVGIGVHCALDSANCSTANGGEPDQLPDEPGGYTGYQGLFGAKYVDPLISPAGPLTDLFGNVIADPHGNLGFPGFDGMSAAVSLSYVASMQEHGIPVTYAYISDAHDMHPAGPAFGPGQAGYEAALHSYDTAFGDFFARLSADGINKSNTLFVVTVDEGDHFVGGTPSPADCDGIVTPCTYSQIGELNANLTGLLATEQGITSPTFAVRSDSAPDVYVNGNPPVGSAGVRSLEQGFSKLTAVNPMTGATDSISRYLADPVEMRLLHMITGDPLRTPSFVDFLDPNYFGFGGAPNCSSPCVTQQPGFAWNHGDADQQIDTTWLGIVGPGVRHRGLTSRPWADHTDTRPTMLALLGLKDDYAHDGRVLAEVLLNHGTPPAIVADRRSYELLARAYKRLNAPVGQFDLESLHVSNVALASSSPADSTYTGLEAALANIGAQRDALAAQMAGILESAAFDGTPINPAQVGSLRHQAEVLERDMARLVRTAH